MNNIDFQKFKAREAAIEEVFTKYNDPLRFNQEYVEQLGGLTNIKLKQFMSDLRQELEKAYDLQS